ncbi:MAG TPA: hypothetical protein VFR30_06530 [Lysobacter sp.]|nr:hypothetical protein [Lysobacter sp.]
MNTPSALLSAALALGLGACASASAPGTAVPPQQAFFANVSALCGKAYAGRIVADQPAPTGADPFTGKPLVMHVRECDGNTIRIPFHVGDDRSRTWVLTRSSGGLRLKHDHRHADGSPDAVTMYGGDTTDAGTASRQQFPVDAESRAMFTREGRSVSNTNVWAMEIAPQRSFVYELAREGRLFRVEFDLAHPVPAPPPPWGDE